MFVGLQVSKQNKVNLFNRTKKYILFIHISALGMRKRRALNNTKVNTSETFQIWTTKLR